jgi:hypothetical protein
MQDGLLRRAADLASLKDGDGRRRAVEVARAGRGLEVALEVRAGRVHRLGPAADGEHFLSELGRHTARGTQCHRRARGDAGPQNLLEHVRSHRRL